MTRLNFFGSTQTTHWYIGSSSTCKTYQSPLPDSLWESGGTPANCVALVRMQSMLRCSHQLKKQSTPPDGLCDCVPDGMPLAKHHHWKEQNHMHRQTWNSNKGCFSTDRGSRMRHHWKATSRLLPDCLCFSASAVGAPFGQEKAAGGKR